jgi:hypothetical protein
MNFTTKEHKIKRAMVLTAELESRLEAEAQRRTCSVSYLVRLACLQLLNTLETDKTDQDCQA